MKFIKTLKHHSAQSLIETIIAIYILVLVIVAILSVGSNYLVLGGQTSERIIALNLAREGLGVVQAIRNSNWLDPNQSWPYGITEGDHLVDFYSDRFDAEMGTPNDSDIAKCDNCALCQQADGYYIHCAEGNYKRLITVSNGDNLGVNCNNDCEKKVVSKVYWVDQTGSHTVETEMRLTDWR